MTRPAPSQTDALAPDAVRALAYFALLAPARPDVVEIGSRDRRDVLEDPEGVLASLTPEQRDRAFHVAGRRLAFQLLYEVDAGGQHAAFKAEELIDATLGRIEGIGPMQAQQVKALALGAWNLRAQADAAFLALAPDWPTHRLAGVDRAILRLCHYEIVSGTTHPRIVLNEAVELARAFGTDKSPAFVNALLDKIAQPMLEKEGEGEGIRH